MTLHALHSAQASQALAAGCHVFVEKLMVTNSRDARPLAAQVRQTGKMLLVGYVPPFTPALQQVRTVIRSGEWGP